MVVVVFLMVVVVFGGAAFLVVVVFGGGGGAAFVVTCAFAVVVDWPKSASWGRPLGHVLDPEENEPSAEKYVHGPASL